MDNTNNIEQDKVDTTNDKKCKEGSELNPNTKRCVKVCPDDFIRDENFKCKSNKKAKRESDKIASILEPENVDATTENPIVSAITGLLTTQNKTKKKREKCPKGTKKNRKTGLCEPFNNNTDKSINTEDKQNHKHNEYNEVKLKKYEDRLKNETQEDTQEKKDGNVIKKQGRVSNTISFVISELETKTGIKYTINDFIYNKDKVFTRDDYLNINSRSVRDIYHILQLKDPQEKYIFLNTKTRLVDKILELQNTYQNENLDDEGDEKKDIDVEIPRQEIFKKTQPLPISKPISIQSKMTSYNAIRQNEQVKQKYNLFDLSEKIPLSLINKDDKDIENEYTKQALVDGSLIKQIETDEYNDNLENDTNTNNYPTLNDPNFSSKISLFKEFSDTKYNGTVGNIKELANKMCNAEFELLPHQLFVKNYLSEHTPYNSLLLYHGVGTGKTCSAIGISEDMRKYMMQTNSQQKIIIVASPNVQKNFYNQLFDESKLKLDGEHWNLHSCIGRSLLQEINPNDVKGLERSKVISNIKNIIKKYYQFMGYIEFSRYMLKKINVSELQADADVKKALEKRRIKTFFDNRLIIIDEVHNIRITDDNTNKQAAKLLMKIAKNSHNMKLLLLSATPMFNSHLEIIWLTNLLNVNDNRSTITQSDIFDSNGEFHEQSEERPEGGRELLQRKLIGYVSYIRGENPYAFPFRIYPEHFDPENNIIAKIPKKQFNGVKINNPLTYIPIYNTNMGTFQLKYYNELISGLPEQTKNMFVKKKFDEIENIGYSLLQKPIDATTIIYPTNSMDEPYDIGKSGFTRIMNFKTDNTIPIKYDYEYKQETLENHGRIFDQENISKYSGKFSKISSKIKKSTGVVLVYSQHIEGTIIPFALMLEEMGFTRYSKTEKSNKNLFKDTIREPVDYKKLKPRDSSDSFKPARYCIITGDKHFSPDNEIDLQTITSIDNKDGELVKVVIISKAVAEGVDFKFIRQIHIIEPWYNMNRPEQIIGRGVRNRSHCALDFEDRNVEIYLYTCQDKSLDHETPDVYMYRNAEYKAKKIGNITRILKTVSVDCKLNISQTNFSMENINKIMENKDMEIRLSSGKTVQYNIGDRPFTELCDYQDNCEYTCSATRDYGKQINFSNYKKYFANANYSMISSRIKGLFQKRFVYSQDELIKEINIQQEYPKEQIFYVLYNMVDNHSDIIIDKHKREGFLINKGDYYAFQPKDIGNENISMFERMHPVDFKNEYMTLDKNTTLIQKAKKTVVELVDNDYNTIIGKMEDINKLIKEDKSLSTKHWTTIVTSKTFQELMFDGVNMEKEKFIIYLNYKILDELDISDKVTLFNVVYYKKERSDYKEQLIHNYLSNKIVNFKSKKYLVLTENEKHKIFIIGKENLTQGSQLDYENLKIPISDKFLIDRNEIWTMFGFNERVKDKEPRLKIKTLQSEYKSNKGVYCNTINYKDFILRLQCIVDGNKCSEPVRDTDTRFHRLLQHHLLDINKAFDKSNKGTTVTRVTLCLFMEFLLRYLDDIKYRNKRYFFDVDETILSQVMKI